MDASCVKYDQNLLKQDYDPKRQTKNLDWQLTAVEDSCVALSASRVTQGTDVVFKFNVPKTSAVIVLTRVANGPERNISVRTNMLPAHSTLDRCGVLRVKATLPNGSKAIFSFQRL